MREPSGMALIWSTISWTVCATMGIYQALSFAIVPPDQFSFRSGAGEALSGGLAALPLWLAYLWLVQRALRTAPPTPPTVA